MNLVANLRERIRVNSVTRIKRSLGGLGKLNVQIGQAVTPSDIIGTYDQNAGFVKLNLAKALASSNSTAINYLQRKIGDKIFKGELLAEKESLFRKKIVTSPIDGVIEDYDSKSGELKLKYLQKQIQLAAGVYGIVERISGSDVYIKTIATEIFGVFGSGKKRGGILRVIDGRSFLMSVSQVKKDMKGHVLVAGALVYKEALHKAIDFEVTGIITGGLNASDFISIAGGISSSDKPKVQSYFSSDIGITTIATEGFGAISMGDDILQRLKQHEGKYAFVSGYASSIVLPVLNPDIIIKLKNIILPPNILEPERRSELMVKEIKVGSKVRLIWSPFAGSQGEVIEIDGKPTTLPSGISTYMLTVQTDMKKFKVPYPNVELIVIN